MRRRPELAGSVELSAGVTAPAASPRVDSPWAAEAAEAAEATSGPAVSVARRERSDARRGVVDEYWSSSVLLLTVKRGRSEAVSDVRRRVPRRDDDNDVIVTSAPPKNSLAVLFVVADAVAAVVDVETPVCYTDTGHHHEDNLYYKQAWT